MSAAEVSARLAALHESVSREMNQITLERDSYSARLRTAEARLQRMRAALASEAELRATLLKLLDAAKSDEADAHDERAQHASELFVAHALVARHERELAHTTAHLDDANHANDELLTIAAQRAHRIAELERLLLLRSEALQPQPQPQLQPQPLHHAPYAYPSTPSKSGHRSSRSHRSSSPRSPRSRRSAADANAGTTTVKKGSALQRFGAPPPLPVAEEAPPLLPQTVPTMPPPLPVVNDEAAELQQTVSAQRDQIRLLQSALARREQDREKLAQLERVVDRLALEVATERELRRELEQANERIVRLRSIVQQQQQQSSAAEPRLFDSAVSLIDNDEQERLSTLPRIDAAAVAAAGGAAAPVYSLPAAITERTLVALTRVVLEKSARAVDDSDADGEENGVLSCASLRASSDGGADAPEGSQTLSHIKELMALLRSPP
jgi:hypothetical protein